MPVKTVVLPYKIDIYQSLCAYAHFIPGGKRVAYISPHSLIQRRPQSNKEASHFEALLMTEPHASDSLPPLLLS